jgi:pimeloyl-ACP methyl ester carboxylesterase
MMSTATDGPQTTQAQRTASLSAGELHYRDSGGSGTPLVFLHGFGANGLLWDGVVDELSRLNPGLRCIVPDWPMGSAPVAMRADADVTPTGMASLVAELLDQQGLEDVTIVGNDSGGAVSQIVVTEHPARISRLVLTNCDCFEKFPPGHFKLLARVAGLPGAGAVLANSMRLRAMRRSPLSYGALTADPIDDAILRAWTEPQIRDAGVRRDGIRFFTATDPALTMKAAEKLRTLEIPALLTWGTADRFFTLDDARRLERTIPDCTLVEIAGGKTFVPLDRPREVATAIAEFLSGGRPAG